MGHLSFAMKCKVMGRIGLLFSQLIGLLIKITEIEKTAVESAEA